MHSKLIFKKSNRNKQNHMTPQMIHQQYDRFIWNLINISGKVLKIAKDSEFLRKRNHGVPWNSRRLLFNWETGEKILWDLAKIIQGHSIKNESLSSLQVASLKKKSKILSGKFYVSNCLNQHSTMDVTLFTKILELKCSTMII